MKKCLVLLLVISLIVGIIPLNVYGETAYEDQLKEAILKTKELFLISDEYDQFNSHVNSSDNKTYFYLNWSDSKERLYSISVNTDSEGNIISFNKYNPVYIEADSKLPNITKEEALNNGINFIKKIDIDLFNQLKLEKDISQINSWDQEYNFSFIRIINNIPYPDNNAYINVNKYTGEVTNYYTNWERDINFPSPENIISLENGKQAYKDEIGLKLMYKSSYRIFRNIDLNEETKLYLAYSPINNRISIDATTGKPINLRYSGPMDGDEKVISQELGGGGLTPVEELEVDKLSGIKSVDEVERVARELLELEVEYLLQNNNLYSDWKNPGEFQWSLNFTKKLENKNLYTNITLDAKTSNLVSFSRNNDLDSNAKASMTRAESLEMALEYINKIIPEKTNQIEYMEDINSKDGELSYYFRFMRKIDDIYVESDSITVGIDSVNKTVISYSDDWFRGDFPPVGELIGYEQAYNVLFDEIGYQLYYATQYNYDELRNDSKEIKLVYSINQDKPAIIGANTGELLDGSGIPYKEDKIIDYIDIDNSYAKDKINTLAEYGVSFNNSEFKPNEKIRQRDFIYLLWKSINSYRTETEADIEKIYTELTRSNIIKEGEANLDRLVTKEEAIKFVIRAMNYEEVAQIPNIYTDLFTDSSDISPGLKGYINIAYGLNIISGNGPGEIAPKYELKRADAASIIYNFIFN